MRSDRIKIEIEAIAKSNGGVIHADHVVRWASEHKRSALHQQFTWDDIKAAHEYRLWQARRLIQVHVVGEDGEALFVSLSLDRSGDGGYRSVTDVLSSQELSEIMLQDALQELERVQTRYARVKQLTSVWRAVSAIKRKTTGKERGHGQARRGKPRTERKRRRSKPS